MGLKPTAHLFVLIMMAKASVCFGQSIRQFTVNDGLPSTHVYEVKQDSKGFYWIATSEGLVRYDGYKIEQLGTGNSPFNRDIWWSFEGNDGKIWGLGHGIRLHYWEADTFGFMDTDIPETDGSTVFSQALQDKYGTLWLRLGSFFYGIKDGKHILPVTPLSTGQTVPIAQPQILLHDSMVHIVFTNPVSVFQLDSSGINSPMKSYPLGIWYRTLTSDDNPLNESNSTLITLTPDSQYVVYDGNLIELSNGELKEHGTFPSPHKLSSSSYTVMKLKNKFAFLSSSGNFITDRSFKHLPQYDIISDYNVNTVYEDHENTIWLSTKDQGLLSVNENAVASKTVSPPKEDHSEIMSIDITKNGDVWAVYKNGAVCKINGGTTLWTNRTPNNIIDPSWHVKKSLVWKDRLIQVLGNYEINFGELDNYMVGNSLGRTLLTNAYRSPLKQISVGADGNLYINDYHRFHRLSDPESLILTTLGTSKVISVSAFRSGEPIVSSYNGTYYLGNIADTVWLSRDIRASRMEVDPAKNVIMLRKGRGMAVASKQGIHNIPELEPYLVNDVFYESDSIMWAATNTGLIKCKVSLTENEYVLDRTFNVATGLPTNDVKCVATDSNNIYIGTSDGLTILDRSKLTDVRSSSNLIITGVYSTTDTLDHQLDYTLDPLENSLRFEYVCISPKSQGNITYHHKLEGLDSKWQHTNELSVTYPFLPPGEYRFLLRATDINGTPSNQQWAVPIRIKQFWYKSVWFIGLLNLFLILAAVAIYRTRISAIGKREAEQAQISQRLADLKLNALRSQMNPHFVFNVLNSIQECFITKNLEEANKYLSDFSKLMRLFLETSGQRYVTISKELSILQPYIELEQMRSTQPFTYMLEVDERIDTDEIMVPSMLIQPIVENAIIHGLKYKETPGNLNVHFYLDEHLQLCVAVEDNGIGRKRSAEINSKRNVHHKSISGEIISERIELLNSSGKDHLKMTVIDLTENNLPMGTKVILVLGLEINDIESELT